MKREIYTYRGEWGYRVNYAIHIISGDLIKYFVITHLKPVKKRFKYIINPDGTATGCSPLFWAQNYKPIKQKEYYQLLHQRRFDL